MDGFPPTQNYTHSKQVKKKGSEIRRESDWLTFRKYRNKVNNMKKHAIANYYDNIDSYLRDANKNNQKLDWKLLKDTFHTFHQINTPTIRALTSLHFEI